MTLASWLSRARRHLLGMRRRREGEASSTRLILEEIEQAAGLVRNLGSKLEIVRDGFLREVATVTERQKETKARNERLIQGLVSLLDHVENLRGQSPRPPSGFPFLVPYLPTEGSGGLEQVALEIVHTKLVQILLREGIREISVSPGDPFDGRFHDVVDTRASDLSRGSVLEVVQKGYHMGPSEGSGRECIIIRPAKVVVSNGPSPRGHEAHSTGES